MRISYWSSDVCSSDLFHRICQIRPFAGQNTSKSQFEPPLPQAVDRTILFANPSSSDMQTSSFTRLRRLIKLGATKRILCSFEMIDRRSEEHTSELQSLMRISYAVFCLKKKLHN